MTHNPKPQPTDVLMKRLRRVAAYLDRLAVTSGDKPAARARANTCWQCAGRLEDYHAKLVAIFDGMACSCRLQPFVNGPVPCPTCQLGALIGRSK